MARLWTRGEVAQAWSLWMGVVVMACSGTLYAFSVYSSDFCERLGYSGTDRSVIIGLGDAGFYLSAVASGWLMDRYGVRLTGTVSAALCAGGYLAMAYTYSGALANSSVALVAFYFFLVGVGSSGIYIIALTPNVVNFSTHRRGLVVGLLVAMCGLSALIFSQIHQGLFVGADGAQDTFGFLVFMAATLGVVGALGAATIVVVRRPRGAPPRPASPINAAASASSARAEAAPLLGAAASDGAWPAKRRPYGAFRIFSTRDFWLMFVAFGLATGAGLMYINSIDLMVGALAGPGADVSHQESVQVSVLSAMSCAGRLGFGLLSDVLLRHGYARRRVLLSVTVALMLVAMATLAAVARPEALTAATVLVGLAYGGLFSTAPTIVSERFGTASFSINWGWVCWATAFGGQGMSSLFGAVWDSHVPVGGECTAGKDCYVLAVYINIGTVALGLAVSTVFSLRRKPTDDAEYVRWLQALEDDEAAALAVAE